MDYDEIQEPAQAAYFRGLDSLQDGDNQAAIDHFHEALEFGLPSEDQVKAKAWLGKAYGRLHRDAEALQSMEDALLQDRVDKCGAFEPEHLRHLIFVHLGHYWTEHAEEIKTEAGPRAALRYLIPKLKLIDHLPGNHLAVAQFEAGYLHAEAGQFADAIPFFRRCIDAIHAGPPGSSIHKFELDLAEKAMNNIAVLSEDDAPRKTASPAPPHQTGGRREPILLGTTSNLQPCKVCGQSVYLGAEQCPHCGVGEPVRLKKCPNCRTPMLVKDGKPYCGVCQKFEGGTAGCLLVMIASSSLLIGTIVFLNLS